jgi:Tfp pilus assembly protein PilO
VFLDHFKPTLIIIKRKNKRVLRQLPKKTEVRGENKRPLIQAKLNLPLRDSQK